MKKMKYCLGIILDNVMFIVLKLFSVDSQRWVILYVLSEKKKLLIIKNSFGNVLASAEYVYWEFIPDYYPSWHYFWLRLHDSCYLRYSLGTNHISIVWELVRNTKFGSHLRFPESESEVQQDSQVIPIHVRIWEAPL